MIQATSASFLCDNFCVSQGILDCKVAIDADKHEMAQRSITWRKKAMAHTVSNVQNGWTPKNRRTSTAMEMGWTTSPVSKSVPAKHAKRMFELVCSGRLVATTKMTSAFNRIVGMIAKELTQIKATRFLYVYSVKYICHHLSCAILFHCCWQVMFVPWYRVSSFEALAKTAEGSTGVRSWSGRFYCKSNRDLRLW